MKLDTLGFGDKAGCHRMELSSFILPRQTEPGELLLVQLGGCHSGQADGPGCICGQTSALSSGPKSGCEGVRWLPRGTRDSYSG